MITLVINYDGSINAPENIFFKYLEILNLDIPTYMNLTTPSQKLRLPNQNIYLDKRYITLKEAGKITFVIKGIKAISQTEKKQIVYKIFSKPWILEADNSYILKVKHLGRAYFWAELFNVSNMQVPIYLSVDSSGLALKIFLRTMQYLHLILKIDKSQIKARNLSILDTIDRLANILKKGHFLQSPYNIYLTKE